MTTNRQFSLALTSLRLAESATGRLQNQLVPAVPGLEEVLSAIGRLPRQALFLGVASDGLPVLLNLHDPLPGPMLVIGDAGAGKTAFLQSIARSLVHTHADKEVQYGVVTGRPEEWEHVAKTGHQVGIFDVDHGGAHDFVLSLASWAHANKNPTQSVLLLVDNLETMAKMEIETLHHFRWLLLRGPVRRVWPIISMNAERYGQVSAWIEIFRTRVFGRVANPSVAQALGSDQAAALEQLEPGIQFSLRENENWLKFWLPSF